MANFDINIIIKYYRYYFVPLIKTIKSQNIKYFILCLKFVIFIRYKKTKYIMNKCV